MECDGMCCGGWVGVGRIDRLIVFKIIFGRGFLVGTVVDYLFVGWCWWLYIYVCVLIGWFC